MTPEELKQWANAEWTDISSRRQEEKTMPADLKKPFAESCCDGGACFTDTKSAEPCGCDPGANWTCQVHRERNMNRGFPVAELIDSGRRIDPREIDETTPPYVIKDSGARHTFASGSLRDTTEGKINYAKVADGPMLKRWAQHLTAGALKYPDITPGVGNWTLIETDEEYARYKESAFRHFMQWFYDDIDEDHAAATFFNINGVEHIKAKNRLK